MADTNILQSINIGGKRFSVPACWEELGLTKEYMLALLSRDEYTPTLKFKPDETVTIYTDPDSGNPAGFHEGQCVVYPDDEIDDGRGISIAKDVILNEQGIPTHIYWLHLSDIEKALKKIDPGIIEALETKVNKHTTEISKHSSFISQNINDINELNPKVSALEKEQQKTNAVMQELEASEKTLERTVTDTKTALDSLKTSHNTLSPFVFRNQEDIAKLTPKVEALESSNCFIAYWPDKDTQQYSFVSLEQWLEMKKTDEALVPVGVLVIPDSGEPFIVSLTESTQRWATSPASTTIVYEDGYSESLGDHFTSGVAAHYRSDKLRQNGAGKCSAAEYCFDHPTDVGGTPMALVWYLPDLKIMMTIAKYRSAINKCLKAIDGATPFNEDKAVSYWTSNEASANKAFIVRMNPFRIFATLKTYQSGLVRPIRYLEEKVFQS